MKTKILSLISSVLLLSCFNSSNNISIKYINKNEKEFKTMNNILSNTIQFNELVYLAVFFDIAQAIKDGKIPSALYHYEKYGKLEGRIDRDSYKSAYLLLNRFNERVYLQAFSDVAKAVKDGKLLSGFHHYLVYGKKENRLTFESYKRYYEAFSLYNYHEKSYLKAFPDVADAVNSRKFVDGLDHFLKHGRGEKRHQKEIYLNVNRFYDENIQIKKIPAPVLGLGSHRGLLDGMDKLRENTLEAIHESFKKNMNVEIDLRFTKDNIPVLSHDDNKVSYFDLNNNIKYENSISQSNYSDIEAYNLAKLEYVFDLKSFTNQKIFIDIKTPEKFLNNEFLNEFLNKEYISNNLNNIVFISPNTEVLNKIKDFNKDIKVCYFLPSPSYLKWQGLLINEYIKGYRYDYIAGFTSVFPFEYVSQYIHDYNVILFIDNVTYKNIELINNDAVIQGYEGLGVSGFFAKDF